MIISVNIDSFTTKLKHNGVSTSHLQQMYETEIEMLSFLPRPNPMPQSPARRMLPSPPSSAPSTKARNNVIQRKQLTAKTMSFPIEESNKSDRNTQRLQLTSVEKRLDDRSSVIPGPTKRTSEKTTIVTTTVTAPCVTTGSNSRKLRQLVLDCRDDQS